MAKTAHWISEHRILFRANSIVLHFHVYLSFKTSRHIVFIFELCALIETTWRHCMRHFGQFLKCNVNIDFGNYFNINSTFHKAMKSFLIKIKCEWIVNGIAIEKCVNKKSYFRNSHNANVHKYQTKHTWMAESTPTADSSSLSNK